LDKPSPDAPHTSLIIPNRTLINSILRRFLPIQVRVVFIIEPAFYQESIYTDTWQIDDQFSDRLESLSAEFYVGLNEAYQDSTPDWVWLRAWHREQFPEQHKVVNNRRYKYSISAPFKEFGKQVVHFVCKDGGIDQNFLTKDIPALLIDLPHLIISEKEYQKKQNEVIRFRVSTEEKEKIEKKAVKMGFKTVSSFLRNLALGT